MRHLTHLRKSFYCLADKVKTPQKILEFFLDGVSPTPAVCGLPQKRAKEAIYEYENFRRGLYAGACGVLSSGGGELMVALRCALANGSIRVFGGAGIVPGSIPSEEWTEINVKMRQFLIPLTAGSCTLRLLPRTACAEEENISEKTSETPRGVVAPPSQSRDDDLEKLYIQAILAGERVSTRTAPSKHKLQEQQCAAAAAEVGPNNISSSSSLTKIGSRPLSFYTKLPNLNTLHATLVIEELVRNGVTHFVVCPGSRSTPLVVAIASLPGITYTVHNDERGAGFYALGYAKAAQKPAAVVVTSGTAVANLLPACVEAMQSHIPLLLLTADRPQELHARGANQCIPGQDSLLYVRWSSQMAPPSVELPAPALLSDVDIAVAVCRGSAGPASSSIGAPGPVQLNFCFRENLAPIGGAVRGWEGSGVVTSSWDPRYLEDDISFRRWISCAGADASCAEAPVSLAPKPFSVFPSLSQQAIDKQMLMQLQQQSELILLVVGALSGPEEVAGARAVAAALGPADRVLVFADICSGLRGGSSPDHTGFYRPDAVPQVWDAADLLLLSPIVQDLLRPDAIIQIGGSVTSTRVEKYMVGLRKDTGIPHVRLTKTPERRDPSGSGLVHFCCSDLHSFAARLRMHGCLAGASARISCCAALKRCREIQSILRKLSAVVDAVVGNFLLCPETILSKRSREVVEDHGEVDRDLRKSMMCEAWMDEEHLHDGQKSFSVEEETANPKIPCLLSEPWIARCVGGTMARVNRRLPAGCAHRLFVSSSMPIREMEVFTTSSSDSGGGSRGPSCAGSAGSLLCCANRGASGIEGILNSAAGYARGLGAGSHVTCLIGDIAALVDANAFHHLAEEMEKAKTQLTIIIVNNRGCGIFAFLPIGQQCQKNIYSPFFDSPSDADFEQLVAGFGNKIRFVRCTEPAQFAREYEGCLGEKGREKQVPSVTVIEAVAGLDHSENVKLHRAVHKSVQAAVEEELIAYAHECDMPGLQLGYSLNAEGGGLRSPASPVEYVRFSSRRGAAGGASTSPGGTVASPGKTLLVML